MPQHPKVPLLQRLAALILLLLASPILAFIPLALLQFGGHPILITDEILHPTGTTTKTLRFRTTGPARDPLFKPLGRILRKWSLDELPALLSILNGDATFSDMSLWKIRPKKYPCEKARSRIDHICRTRSEGQSPASS